MANPKSLKFGLIGAAGYVAPRHMAAIKAVGGELVAACDPHDSVGILDSFFPSCQFFTDNSKFLKFCANECVEFISVCSPNYLHDIHAAFCLALGADVILEKPACISTAEINRLQTYSKNCNHRIYPILQCRLHPAVTGFRQRTADKNSRHTVAIEYVTPRGQWYDASWKGDRRKSGGLAANIGVHLFDLCCYLFGKPLESSGRQWERRAAGNIKFVNADVNWYLSIDGSTRKRIFKIDGEPLDLTNGFDDLHGECYRRILACDYWQIEDAREAIKLCEGLDVAE